MGKTIAVLGAGNAGTTFALLAAHDDNAVRLWTIEQDVAAMMREGRENRKYLPGVMLPGAIAIEVDLEKAIAGADIVMLTVPSHVVRRMAQAIAPWVTSEQIIVDVAKGLEEKTFYLMSEVIHSELPVAVRKNIVALSGPSIAREMSRGVPTAVAVAGFGQAHAEAVRQALQTPAFQVIVVDDIVGIQLGGSLKNIYALAAGMCDGLEYGVNTKAAFIPHALAEMVQFGVVLGARPETFYGLAGLGDLVVTCLGPQSRNRTLGEKLARGQPLARILRESVEVSEGVQTTKVAHALGQKLRLRLPLLDTIYRILFEGRSPHEALPVFLTGAG
ncbi:MAG: NAD(P)-dependent glycerol-3-phosphate dehydrogenase [Nitrospinae bacterium]|nr:NAD(P)-dependent glycerol-3-phosphate dehydrogenase [Nitrospinota bacterium]